MLLAIVHTCTALADVIQNQTGDGQRAILNRFDDVLSVGADFADRCAGEGDRVRRTVHILPLAVGGNAFKGNAGRCAGIAVDHLNRSVIDLAVAVRGQGDVPVIVEVDDVPAGGDSQRLLVRTDGRVAVNRDRSFRDCRVKGLAGNGLRIENRFLACPDVIDRVAEVGALGVGDDQGQRVARHGATHDSLIRHIAFDLRRDHAIRFTLCKGRSIVLCRFSSSFIEILDSQREGVLDVVHADDVVRRNCADGQREVFVLIKLVAGRALVGVAVDDCAEVSGAGFGQRVVLAAVDVILDGVAVAFDLPDGVEVVTAVVVDHGISAFCVVVTCTVCLCVPALEGVALACSQARRRIGLDCDQSVVSIFFGIGLLRRAEVAVVGQADGGGLGAEDGAEGGIVGHFDGRAGFVDVAALGLFPAEEDLACGRSRCRTDHNDCVGVLCVVVAVFNDIRLAVDAVGQRVAGHAADLGVQLIVFGDRCVKVERGAVLQRPAVELFFIDYDSDLVLRRPIFRDLRAVRDVLDLIQLGITLPEGHGMDRGDPLGVEGNVLRRHGLAGEDILLALAQLVVVPAVEDVAVHARRRIGRFKICVAGDIRFELDSLGLYVLAAADELELVVVAGVEEFRAVIGISSPHSIRFKPHICKACNRVFILIRNRIALSGTRIRMMKLILNLILGHLRRFTGKDLYIVISCLASLAALRPVEACAAQRHGIDVGLICAAPIAGRP